MIAVRKSLRYRLPAGIALIVALAVTLYGALAYSAARRVTEEAARVRLRSVAERFAQLTRGPLAARLDQVEAAAQDPRVITFLSTGTGRGPALTALERLGPDTGLAVAVGLRDTAGSSVLTLQRPLPTLPPGAVDRPDTAQVTRLFRSDADIEYELLAPVTRRGRIVGHVVTRRVLRSNPQTVETLRGLMGSRAILLVGNGDGSLWSDLIRPVARPAMDDGEQSIEHDGQRWLAAVTPIPESPLAIAVEFPYAGVLAPINRLLWIFGGLAALVVALGAVAGWFLSRRLTDPLLRLTSAAEALAAGQHTAEHPTVRRDDEVGRLDRAFADMARNVEQARDRLEQQVEERTAELQQAQNELIRTEKMAVLGQLASSVGHELRNPLGVMSNIVYYLNATLTDLPPKARNHLEMLKRQIVLAEKIVSDILDFTRVKPPESRDVGVAAFIEEQLQRVELPQHVRVQRDLNEDLPSVHADPVQIGQVLYNVLTNAVQAMDAAGGVLTVRGRRENGMVRIEIADQGPGIPRGERDRIFEPLFTTKQRGIGLGLSVSRSLAQANGGDLFVVDQDAPGAVFCLELPVASDDA